MLTINNVSIDCYWMHASSMLVLCGCHTHAFTTMDCDVSDVSVYFDLIFLDFAMTVMVFVVGTIYYLFIWLAGRGWDSVCI